MTNQHITIENGVIMDIIMPKDGIYEITKKKKTRRLVANRYYWSGVLTPLSEYSGYTKDEIHELMKQKFLSYEKGGHIFTKDTKSLKVHDFYLYIEDIRAFAKGWNVIILTPDEWRAINNY